MALSFLPPIILGAVIGLYEMILIHRDVQVPQHRAGHAVHAFTFAIIGTFISFNVPFVLELTKLGNVPVLGSVIGIRIAIALIMAIKIHGVSAALKSAGQATAGMRETWLHSLIVGVLVGFTPYIWPLISGFLPAWLQ